MSSQKLTQSPLTYSVAALAPDKSFLRYNDKYSPLPRHARSSLHFTPSPSKQQKEQQLAAELESSQATCSVLRARVAALKQQLTVKTSDAAALADKVSSLTLQLDCLTKTQTARVSATVAYQTLKGEATAAAKQSAGLEAALKAAQQQLEDSKQEIADLQDSLHREHSAHQLTAQREEQAAAALAAEHQRHGSSSSALTSAHQQLQAKQAETELLLAQLCDADSTVVQLQGKVAVLTQRLQNMYTTTLNAMKLAVIREHVSAQLAEHCTSLTQQLEDSRQQQEAAATQAASTIRDLQETAARMEIENASLQASLAVKQSLQARTASALLAAQQVLTASAAAAAQPVADMVPAAQIGPLKQQPAQHSRKAPRSKPARKQPYASTGSYAILQQQLATTQALLQKQADAAAAAATRASSAEWRVGKLSAECSHLQQQHAADASAISSLKQQLQQLQSQLPLLQQEPVQTLQQQYQEEEQQQQQGHLQAPSEAKQGAKDNACLHSLPGDTNPLTDTLQDSIAVTQQRSRPQYVPPLQYTQAYLGWTTATEGQAAAVPGPADQAASALHPSSTVAEDIGVVFPGQDNIDVAAVSESLAGMWLTRQWGSGLCEARYSESDSGSSRRSSSSIGDGTAGPDASSHPKNSSNSGGTGSSNSSASGGSQKQSGEDGAVLASSGSLQGGEDAKDSFYTALEALSEEGDE